MPAPSPHAHELQTHRQAELNVLSETAEKLGTCGGRHTKTPDAEYSPQVHEGSLIPPKALRFDSYVCACVGAHACMWEQWWEVFLSNSCSPFGESLNSKRYLIDPFILSEAQCRSDQIKKRQKYRTKKRYVVVTEVRGGYAKGSYTYPTTTIIKSSKFQPLRR